MTKKQYVILLIVLAFVLILASIFVVYMLETLRYNELSQLDYSSVNIDKLPDGNYAGESSALWHKVKLELSISNGHIKNVQFHKVRPGSLEAAKEIITKVKQNNSLDVDLGSDKLSYKVLIKAALYDALSNN